jgi:hypothetical protein
MSAAQNDPPIPGCDGYDTFRQQHGDVQAGLLAICSQCAAYYARHGADVVCDEIEAIGVLAGYLLHGPKLFRGSVSPPLAMGLLLSSPAEADALVAALRTAHKLSPCAVLEFARDNPDWEKE